MQPTITIDVGTTSVKLSLFDGDGAMVASANSPTPTVQDAWGEIYDVPALEAMVDAFILSIPPGKRDETRRIAVTGVGSSGALVRADLSLASPMILWHDQRGSAYVERLTEAERQRVYALAGIPAHANYGLAKAAWALDNATGPVDGAQWLNVVEYLAAKLTGERWAEYSLASRTMALNLGSRAWSPTLCALFGLQVSILPVLRAAETGVRIRGEVARGLGLPGELRVHVAGHDHMVGGVAAGLARGELLNSTGTTEGLLILQDAPSVGAAARRSQLANGVYCEASTFTLFASIPTGGSAFATLRTLTGMSEHVLVQCIDDLHKRWMFGRIDLSSVPLVLPQFAGSPPPAKQSSARGIVSGISPDTTPEDLVLGCFLGMALQFQDVLRLFPSEPDVIKVIGPASRNPLWLQIKADLLGKRLSVSRSGEVVSRGAQSLASGAQSDWSTREPRDVEPDPARWEALDRWSTLVRPRWEHLKATPV